MKTYITGPKNIGSTELQKDIEDATWRVQRPGLGYGEVYQSDKEKIEKNLTKENLLQPNDRGETALMALLKLTKEVAKESYGDSKKICADLMKRIDPSLMKHAERETADRAKMSKPFSSWEVAKDKILMKQEDKNTLLFASVQKGDMQGIQNALTIGADVNARDGKGNTPIMLASHIDRVSCINTLIQAGADVNAKNYQGQNALHLANEEPNELDSGQFQYTGVLEQKLIQAGADVNAVDVHGRTPIMLAENAASAAMLKDNGAKMDGVKEFWANEGKESLVNEFEKLTESEDYQGQAAINAAEEAFYAEAAEDQTEDEDEQQGRSA